MRKKTWCGRPVDEDGSARDEDGFLHPENASECHTCYLILTGRGREEADRLFRMAYMDIHEGGNKEMGETFERWARHIWDATLAHESTAVQHPPQHPSYCQCQLGAVSWAKSRNFLDSPEGARFVATL